MDQNSQGRKGDQVGYYSFIQIGARLNSLSHCNNFQYMLPKSNYFLVMNVPLIYVPLTIHIFC